KISKWVLHSLTPKNKLQRLTHLTRSKTEPIYHRSLTCDEKWIMYSNHKRFLMILCHKHHRCG
ncbi:hypothetical protein WH47_06922, partial [Habropoda laboriosa]